MVSAAVASPSMRREWIEIDDAKMADWQGESPSMRREWIEIRKDCSDPAKSRSPSMRREWIEMISWQFQSAGISSLPPCGGSGLKSFAAAALDSSSFSLPPCGGSGLKCRNLRRRRLCRNRLPPCGGSGLKCLFPIQLEGMTYVSLHAEGVD